MDHPQQPASSKVRRWARKAPGQEETAPAAAHAPETSAVPAEGGDAAGASPGEPRAAPVRRLEPQRLDFPLDPERDASGLAAGDSYLIAHFLTPAEADAALHALLPLELGGSAEVPWIQMYGKDGRPFARLKNTQANPDPTSLPIYRYPTNNQHACQTDAWSDTIGMLRDKVSALTRQPINHCVANLYRNEHDFIGPHKDKMLDILEGSVIASLSLGAERPMILEHEDGVQKQVVPLRHGSLFIIGAKTNEKWLHSIPKHEKHCGPRVSLTLRQMGTFMDTATGAIRGQGASLTPAVPKTLPLRRLQDPNWPLWDHDLSIKPTVTFPRRRPLDREVRVRHAEGGSTFDCLLLPCADASEVQGAQERLRAEHPDACHIPCAWLIRRQRPQPGQGQGQGASSTRRPQAATLLASRLRGWDADGEPVARGPGGADTARDGLYAPLEASGLTDCAVLVVRHWDGVRLGLSRLLEAYRASIQLALHSLADENRPELPAAPSAKEAVAAPGPGAKGGAAAAPAAAGPGSPKGAEASQGEARGQGPRGGAAAGYPGASRKGGGRARLEPAAGHR